MSTWVLMAGFVPGAASSAWCHKLSLMGRARYFTWHWQGTLGQSTKPGNGGDTYPCSKGETQPPCCKALTPPFLKVSCKIHNWEKMHGLQVTL